MGETGRRGKGSGEEEWIGKDRRKRGTERSRMGCEGGSENVEVTGKGRN